MPDSLANTWFKLVLAYLDDYEICYVRTHTGNGVFTDVLRGQEGSTQREWPVDHLQTTAFIAPVAADMAYFLSAIKTLQDGKVDKAAGKVLSSNDFTNTERVKLANIAEQATKNAADDKLRDRSTHTGTQAIATVTGLQTALDSKLPTSGGVLTGNLTVPSLNGGQLAGMRNKINNGNFSVNQRVVSGTVTLAAGAYGHDRWKAGASGCTYTCATTQNVTTITITSGSLVQVIEGLNLQSGTHVLSWQGTAQGRVDVGAYGESGGVTGTAVGGTNQTIEFNAGTVRLVQYEPGTVATPFEHRPYGVELELCQRYLYPLHRPGASSDTIGYGGMFRTSVGQAMIPGTRLRAAPSIIGVPLILVGAATGGSTAITAVELLASGDVFLLTSGGSYTAQPAFLAKNAINTRPTFLAAEL